MKLFPLILAIIFLVSGMFPCKEGLVCQEAGAAQTHACEKAEDKHSCCQLPAEEDHFPAEKNPCSKGCSCYCCLPVMALAPGVSTVFSQLGTDRRNSWRPSMYAHEFTHLIWQPPQAC